MGQLHEIISDSLAIKAHGRRRVFIVEAVWISLVSDIVPECSNVVLISTDQLGNWMAPPNEPETKVNRDQRKEHEHRGGFRKRTGDCP